MGFPLLSFRNEWRGSYQINSKAKDPQRRKEAWQKDPTDDSSSHAKWGLEEVSSPEAAKRIEVEEEASDEGKLIPKGLLAKGASEVQGMLYWTGGAEGWFFKWKRRERKFQWNWRRSRRLRKRKFWWQVWKHRGRTRIIIIIVIFIFLVQLWRGGVWRAQLGFVRVP